VEQTAGLRRLDPPRGANKQVGLELLLKTGNLLADDGLRDAKPISRPGKGGCVHDCGKIGKSIEIDGFQSSTSNATCMPLAYSMSYFMVFIDE
jgi:hypothetical protein